MLPLALDSALVQFRRLLDSRLALEAARDPEVTA
jgi:hypothetical protein